MRSLPRLVRVSGRLAVGILLLLSLPALAAPGPEGEPGDEGPGSLPEDGTIEGRLEEDGGARWTLETDEAGILCVAVRADEDVVVELRDAWGQVLATSDRDLDGDAGAEQAAFSVPRSGTWEIVVRPWSGRAAGSAFRGVVRFVPFAPAARPPDPHGDPSRAREVAVDEEVDGELDPARGDRIDWYRIRAPGSGRLVVATEGETGDLLLRAHRADAPGRPVARSDRDLRGSPAAEAVAVPVEEGEELLCRVVERAEGAARYTLRVSFETR